MRKLILTGALAALIALALGATSAHAASCGGWSTSNAVGEWARVTAVHPEGTMNCASSRYVVNQWLKRSWQRAHYNHLPGRFFDGYVTWDCGKTSYYGWRCSEYTSGTSFRFRGYYYG